MAPHEEHGWGCAESHGALPGDRVVTTRSRIVNECVFHVKHFLALSSDLSAVGILNHRRPFGRGEGSRWCSIASFPQTAPMAAPTCFT